MSRIRTYEIDTVIPRIRDFYVMRPSHERNPFAMIANYEMHFDECDQGKGIPLLKGSVSIEWAASAE